MKKTLLPLLLLFSINTFAQRVTYSDLKFLLYHNLADSEDYLNHKGFSFDGTRTAKTDTNATELIFSKNPQNSKTYIRISKSAIKNNYYTVAFDTYLLSDYTSIKDGIKKIGFKMTRSQIYKGSLVSEYIKGKISFTFWTSKDEDIGINEYTINITNSDFSNIAFESESH